MTGCGGSPSRDPDTYAWTEHFREDSIPDELRFLSTVMIQETIREGRDCDRQEAGRGNLRRKKTYSGVDAVLVLPEEGGFVITGWTEIADLSEAATSEKWDMDQLEKIQSFQDRYEPSFKPIG